MNNNKWAVKILESNMEGYTPEERTTYLEDVRSYGCQAGSVSGVIYFYETEELFKQHMEEILDRVAEYEEDTGFNPIPGFIESGHTETLYNYLVWYVVELTAQDMLGDSEA